MVIKHIIKSLMRFVAGEPYYRFIPFRLLRAFMKNVRVNVGSHSLVIPTNEAESLKAIYWKPNWKTKLIKQCLNARTGSFVDVGVNVGQTLLDWVAADSEVDYFGFEPNPACIEFISNAIELNNLEKCTILPVGLSDKCGLVCLYSHPSSSTDASASIISDLRPNRELRSRYVPCVRFDEVWDTLKKSHLNLIKIDVEGAELEVLRGMKRVLREERPVILVEVLFMDYQADLKKYAARISELEAVIDESSYKIYNIIKREDESCDFKQMNRFPLQPWTTENADKCDYLLIPSEAKFEQLID